MVKIKFELYQNSTTAVKMEDDNNKYSIVFWVGDGQPNNVQEMVTQFDQCLVNLIVKQKLTIPLPIIQPTDHEEYPSYFAADDANCLITRILLPPNIEQDKIVAPALMKAINETLNKYACFKWGPLDKCAIFDDTVINYQFDSSTTTFPVSIVDALNREFKDYHQKLIIPTNLLPDDGEQSSISARSDIAVIMEADEESEDGTTLSEEEDNEETEDEENVNPKDNQTLPRLRRKRRDDDGDIAVIMEAGDNQENVNPNDNQRLARLRKGTKKKVKSTTKRKGKRAKKRVKSTRKRKGRTMNQGRRTDIKKTAQSHPFKCKYKHQNGKLCGQRYRTKSDINDHQKVHMKEQGKPSWRCPFQNCSNTDGFARKETCKQHIIKVHTQEWENQVSLNGGIRSKQFAKFLKESWLKKQHYDEAALVYRWSDDAENKEGDKMDIGDPEDSDKDEDNDHHDGNEEKKQERMDIGDREDSDKGDDNDCDIVLASDSEEDGDPEDSDSDAWLNLPGIRGIKTHSYRNKGNALDSRRRTTDRPKSACYTYSVYVGDSDDEGDNDQMEIEHLSWNELCQRKYGKAKGTIYFEQKILKPYQQQNK